MEKAIHRQRVLLKHLQQNPSHSSFHLQSTHLSASACVAGKSSYGKTDASENDDNDVVIIAAHRTAICKAKRGGFKDTPPDDLLASVLKAVIEKTNVKASEVGDIVVGTVLAPGADKLVECRLAAFYAGFPGIGAGLEYMTQDSIITTIRNSNPKVETLAQAQDFLLPVGITSENLAQRYGVTRQEQDQASVESHKRAAAATTAGKFKEEIIPLPTKIVDPKTGEEKKIVVCVDDCIRPNTTLMDLAKLKPSFQKNGSTTAGNSSQVSDGAAAVLLMKRRVAMQRKLPILGIFRSFATVGVDPAVKGVGPVYAIPAALESAGLDLSNIDLFEINEAFASQFVYCCKKLALDLKKVNVNGGAIALGHPLGATGARCVATLLHEMKRRGKDCRFGVISMCIGTGMGAAAVFERGDT
ncbi:3-ketoacyl CoA thiolase 1, peroxisomal-like [Arachis duranensis]|uniref:acetyl-CoA C-acyltransferase n=1 Tax=Arachis duranensis TaxID=130453 RepID=A0A6P4CFA7_ARADU|nr:3-ketoacyl CoA thiolase 1, peroxisomal-like [Arachis duranensis]